MRFCVGDKVMLSAKNIKQARPSRKLSDKYLGPFDILEPVRTQVYCLRLSEHWKIHPVFHVSLLEPHQWGEGGEMTESQPLPELIEGEEQWEVEAILDKRTLRGKEHYLVWWKEFFTKHDSWQPAKNVEGAPKLVNVYHQWNTGVLTAPRWLRGKK